MTCRRHLVSDFFCRYVCHHYNSRSFSSRDAQKQCRIRNFNSARLFIALLNYLFIIPGDANIKKRVSCSGGILLYVLERNADRITREGYLIFQELTRGSVLVIIEQ